MPLSENTAHRGWPMAVHCSRRQVGSHEWFTKRAMPPFLFASRYLKAHRPSAKLCGRRILTWIVEAPNDTKEITPFSIHVNRGSDRSGFVSRIDRPNYGDPKSLSDAAVTLTLHRAAGADHRAERLMEKKKCVCE